MMATKLFCDRRLQAWMLWLNSSFPVPVSPTTTILESVWAKALASWIQAIIRGLRVMISPKVYLALCPL